MGAFDVATKHLIEARPRDWLALMGFSASPSAKITVVDGELSTMTTAADKLIFVDDTTDRYVMHVEFQSGADKTLDQRILTYNVFARWRHKVPVRSVVFLLRPGADSPGNTGRFINPAVGRNRLEFGTRWCGFGNCRSNRC